MKPTDSTGTSHTPVRQREGVDDFLNEREANFFQSFPLFFVCVLIEMNSNGETDQTFVFVRLMTM